MKTVRMRYYSTCDGRCNKMYFMSFEKVEKNPLAQHTLKTLNHTVLRLNSPIRSPCCDLVVSFGGSCECEATTGKSSMFSVELPMLLF